MQVDPNQLVVQVPDTRGVTIDSYGRGNLKIGLNVRTYSRLPGLPTKMTLGYPAVSYTDKGVDAPRGTCPGATEECLAICYARRPVAEQGIVYEMWRANSASDEVPPIPDECRLLRIHVAGDFTSYDYIRNWIVQLVARPDVKAWAYTRSWRVPHLLPALEALRALPNMQLFASMDASTSEMPPKGWRRAWIRGDERVDRRPRRIPDFLGESYSLVNDIIRGEGVSSYVCPEETGRKSNCEACRYCFDGRKHDVTFLKH